MLPGSSRSKWSGVTPAIRCSSSNAGMRRAAAITRWPARASASAVSRPMPELAPVSKIVWVVIGRFLLYHGFDCRALFLRAICARAKLTRGSFYVHFADREALLIAVMQHVLGEFVASLAGARGVGDPAAAIRSFFAVAKTGGPALHPAGALRFHHVIEACRRSRVIREAYLGHVMAGRDLVAMGIARDQHAKRARGDVPAPALADVMVVIALGMAAMLELDIELEIPRLGDTLLA